jgi:hypothetical protein
MSSILQLICRHLPKMDSRIEINMLKLFYTENVMMFQHTERQLRRFENLVFPTLYRLTQISEAEIPYKCMGKTKFSKRHTAITRPVKVQTSRNVLYKLI